MNAAFRWIEKGETCFETKDYAHASEYLMNGVREFNQVLKSGQVGDPKSAKLIKAKCREYTLRAAAAQDLADERQRALEKKLFERLSNLKVDDDGTGDGQVAAVPGGDPLSQLNARLSKLRGPKKPAPSMESIEQRFAALKGPQKTPPKEADIQARLEALGPSQFQQGDAPPAAFHQDHQFKEIMASLVNQPEELDDLDDQKLRALVDSVLQATGGGQGPSDDGDSELAAMTNQFLGGGGYSDDVDDDDVARIIQQAKDEIKYGNPESSTASSAGGGGAGSGDSVSRKNGKSASHKNGKSASHKNAKSASHKNGKSASRKKKSHRQTSSSSEDDSSDTEQDSSSEDDNGRSKFGFFAARRKPKPKKRW